MWVGLLPRLLPPAHSHSHSYILPFLKYALSTSSLPCLTSITVWRLHTRRLSLLMLNIRWLQVDGVLIRTRSCPSLKLPAIILVSDRLTNLPIHPLIHSSSQPQSRRVTHPHTHSAFRCYQRKDLGERLFLCAISLCRGIIFTGDAVHLLPAVL